MSDTPAPAKPSASVVIVRDAGPQLEILLVRRNEKIAFHGGAWVFPGGRVDANDDAGAEVDTAKQAAAREALEETGLAVEPDAMVPFAHWTTPIQLPKRFATWFFVAEVERSLNVVIDNSEIVDYRWMTANAALAAHRAGDLTLPGPTFVTLLGFKDHVEFAAMKSDIGAIGVQRFVPRLVPVNEGRCTLYEEDAGYEALDFDAPGPRHRLIMQGTDWDYQRSI